MKEITMFQADDGKMFDDEDECRDYEHEVATKAVNGQIALFDMHRKPLSLLQAVDDAFYARVDTEEALDWFKDALYDQGYTSEGLEWYGKPDIYIWDRNETVNASWLSWNKIVEGMTEERNELIKAGILNAWGN